MCCDPVYRLCLYRYFNHNHNKILDTRFDAKHNGAQYKSRYEVVLLLLSFDPEPPITLCFSFDRSEGGVKCFGNVEIYFEMCRNVEICFLRIQISKFRR